MRSPQVKSLLKVLPKTQPVLLIGPPGVGKSEVVRQFARVEAKVEGREFIDFHKVASNIDKVKEIVSNPQKYYIYVDFRLTKCVPEDLLGLPEKIVIDGVTVYNYNPPIWAKLLSLPGISGLLFLDEITNVERDDVKAVSYKLLLDRKAGYVPFGKGVMVIAAGNRPEESSIARPLAAPQMNRVIKVDVDVPTVDEWAEWMERNKPSYCKEILAYLMMFKDDLLRLPKDPEVLENFPTPRSWTLLAETLTEDYRDIYGSSEVYELAKGTVGAEVAPKVQKFLTSRIPPIDELISKPEMFVSLSLEGKYVATVVLGRWLQEHRNGVGRARKLIEVITEVSEELIVLLIKSIVRNRVEIASEIYNTSDKVREVMDKLADLMIKYER